jgi:hypothetical protein
LEVNLQARGYLKSTETDDDDETRPL